MRTLTFITWMLLAQGCSNKINYYEPDALQFDWVEPLQFQHNLRDCRVQDYCRAETLFG